MKINFLDLRFIIGLFFLIVGLIVFAVSFSTSNVADGQAINHATGIAFLVFAGLMLLSFRFGKQ
jgi:hypothetical protein